MSLASLLYFQDSLLYLHPQLVCTFFCTAIQIAVVNVISSLMFKYLVQLCAIKVSLAM